MLVVGNRRYKKTVRNRWIWNIRFDFTVSYPNIYGQIPLDLSCRKHVFDIVCNMFSTSFRQVSNKSETCFRQKQKVCDKKC